MKTEKKPADFEARQIVRGARAAALATCDFRSGAPFVSLAAVATLTDGRPIILISTLARHTQNLLENPAASLLFEIPAAKGGVMAGSRITLSGQMNPCENISARRRYLARHEDARDFVDFTDFGFYQMEIAEGHLIAAFGRIETIAGKNLFSNASFDAELAAQETNLIDQINTDHSQVIQTHAAKTAGVKSGNWRVVDIDREGFSISLDQDVLRIIFSKPLESLADLQNRLAEMADMGEKL